MPGATIQHEQEKIMRATLCKSILGGEFRRQMTKVQRKNPDRQFIVLFERVKEGINSLHI